MTCAVSMATKFNRHMDRNVELLLISLFCAWSSIGGLRLRVRFSPLLASSLKICSAGPETASVA